MNHVLSMRLARHSGHNDEATPTRRADPVRRIVQTTLVVYLAPVLLAVLLIGGIAIVATQTITALTRGTRWLIG